MAITAIDYTIIKHLRDRGLLPRGPAVLELGEANWYSDVDPAVLANDISHYVTDAGRQMELVAQLQDYQLRQPRRWRFDIAKIFYETFLNYRTLTAIDKDESTSALHYDLNLPLPLKERFDIVLNLGTAEHIFDVAQVFTTVHDRTVAGGLMLHATPFQGWPDHGFYNFQPTFYFDLALANAYEMLLFCYCELGEGSPPRMDIIRGRDEAIALMQKGGLGANSLLYAVMRKSMLDKPFAVPMQGYYDGTLSKAGNAAWATLR